MISLLDAVNQCLASIGEPPVSSLDSGLPDGQRALAVIARETKTLCGTGWSWNTRGSEDHPIELLPDVEGLIRLPETTLRVEPMSYSRTMRVAERKHPTAGRCLFDLEKNTFEFGGALRCRVVEAVGFEELPHQARDYIAAKAAVEFQRETMGSVALDRFTRARMADALAALHDQEQEQEQVSMLDAPDLTYIHHRRRVL